MLDRRPISPRAFALAALPTGARGNVLLRVGLPLVSLLVYVALNFATDHRSLNGSSVTLWSPDDALTLLLMMESPSFGPFLWLGAVGIDIGFGHAGRSIAIDAAAQMLLTAGYGALAWGLRSRFGVNIWRLKSRDLVALMAVLPVGLAGIGFAYCVALVAAGVLKANDFLITWAGFWIGDAAAMCVLLPAVGALVRAFADRRLSAPGLGQPVVLFAATLIYCALVVYISTETTGNRYVFDLLYLPILLVGLKYGFDAGALTLLVVQLLLLGGLEYFHVSNAAFAGYQVLMFILAISGLALGATHEEWEQATSQLRRQQAELAKLSERATNAALAAAVSHEISQPLAAIAAFLFAGRRLLENGDARERALAALRRAEAEAARARLIVERMRDFVAKGPGVSEPVDIGEAVQAMLRLQGDAAFERGVELVGDGVASGALTVRAERLGVEQAIANLLANAVEAAPAGEGRVVVTATRRGAHAVVAVEDNGAGVAAEIAGRLFEPFETTKPRGMGLGLPLAREIAVRHGGGLSWRPLAPSGARFELELPLA